MSELEKYRKLVTERYPPFHAVETQFVKEYADDAIAELEEENERLRVCGNCKHFDAEEFQYCNHPKTLDAGWDGDRPYYISAPDKCSFTPSRWAERGTP